MIILIRIILLYLLIGCFCGFLIAFVVKKLPYIFDGITDKTMNTLYVRVIFCWPNIIVGRIIDEIKGKRHRITDQELREKLLKLQTMFDVIDEVDKHLKP